jgi:hypothetical protein
MKPWSTCPGLRGRPLTTRVSIDDWIEEFDLHDSPSGQLVVRPWCRTCRLTDALCSDPELAKRMRYRVMHNGGW